MLRNVPLLVSLYTVSTEIGHEEPYYNTHQNFDLLFYLGCCGSFDLILTLFTTFPRYRMSTGIT